MVEGYDIRMIKVREKMWGSGMLRIIDFKYSPRPEGPQGPAPAPQVPEAQPRNSAEDEGADASSGGQ